MTWQKLKRFILKLIYFRKNRKWNQFFEANKDRILQWHKAHRSAPAPLPVYWDNKKKDFAWRSRDDRRLDVRNQNGRT